MYKRFPCLYLLNTPSISLGPQPQTDNCQVLTIIITTLFYSSLETFLTFITYTRSMRLIQLFLLALLLWLISLHDLTIIPKPPPPVWTPAQRDDYQVLTIIMNAFSISTNVWRLFYTFTICYCDWSFFSYFF